MSDTEKTYHHGQLRQALLVAALQITQERGIGGLTLRETARVAGVSHAAPYHHFKDKAALIEALVIDGFDGLYRSLSVAAAQPALNALDRLQATGIAYARFALINPTLFQLMARPELYAQFAQQGSATNPVSVAGQRAFDVLSESVAIAQKDGFIPPGDPTIYTLTAWSLVHGLVCLLLDKFAGGPPALEVPMDVQLVYVEQVTRVLKTGLHAASQFPAKRG